MTSSSLQQYTVADFLEWQEKKQLIINRDFQRREVWTADASAYLIDTILRQLPIPKIYLRTHIDVDKRLPIREIVDGQQRISAVIKYAGDKLTLTKRTGEFSGLTYSAMETKLKERFLSYEFGVEQLINATNENVLEVFARLNSYSVQLNHAELRHAKYQGDFKWVVHNAASRWNLLWDDIGILTVRRRSRMADDQLMAEMLGVLLDGVTDGGRKNLDRMYKKYDPIFTEDDYKSDLDNLNKTLSFMTEQLRPAIQGAVARPTHFLMLFAAAAHGLFGIPRGDIDEDFPEADASALGDISIALDNLSELAAIIDTDDPPENKKFRDFWSASRGATIRIGSRRIRFTMFYQALLPEHL